MEGEVKVLKATDLNDILESFSSRVKSDIEAAKPDLSKVATMEDVQKAFEAQAKPEVITKEEAETEIAEHEKSMAGVFDQAINFEIQGIQVGRAAVGGFAAIFTSELIDGFATAQSANTRGFIKLGVGWAMVAFASKWLGKSFTGATALLLTFDAIRDLTPLNEWAANLADKITGTSVPAGLRGDTGNTKMGAFQQAQNVANNYASIISREG